MHYLSRRFSGVVYLYVVAASIVSGIIESYVLPFYWLKILFEFLIYLPPLVYIAAKKYPVGKILRINKFRGKDLWFVVGISLCTYLVVMLLYSLIRNLFNISLVPDYPVEFFSTYGFPYLINMILFCIIYPSLQVAVYQGAIQSGFHDLNPLKTCLFTGILYSLMSADLLRFVPYIIFGFVLSYISIKTVSIIPAFIASFFFNFFREFRLESLLYSIVFKPLGFSENLSLMILVALSIIIGGILLKKMSETASSAAQPINSDVFRGLGEKLRRFRKSLQLSWYHENDSQQTTLKDENAPYTVPEEMNSKTIYPDNSDKQKMNTGFKISITILGILTLAEFVLSIYQCLHSSNVLS